jgi:hypothetical protein
MKTSKTNLLIWGIGFLMPLWLAIADPISKSLFGTELSGRWLYVSVIAGASICAIAVFVSAFSIWQRVALVIGSWVLLAGEVLVLGAFYLSKNGLVGTQ